jgi:hypothetical protein
MQKSLVKVASFQDLEVSTKDEEEEKKRKASARFRRLLPISE